MAGIIGADLEQELPRRGEHGGHAEQEHAERTRTAHGAYAPACSGRGPARLRPDAEALRACHCVDATTAVNRLPAALPEAPLMPARQVTTPLRRHPRRTAAYRTDTKGPRRHCLGVLAGTDRRTGSHELKTCSASIRAAAR